MTVCIMMDLDTDCTILDWDMKWQVGNRYCSDQFSIVQSVFWSKLVCMLLYRERQTDRHTHCTTVYTDSLTQLYTLTLNMT